MRSLQTKDVFIEDGRPVLRRFVDVHGLEKATDAQAGRYFRERLLHEGQTVKTNEHVRKSCCHAEAADVRWLGVTWIGKPYPKRLRLRTPIYAHQARGCGCIRWLKERTEAMKRWFNGEA